MIEIASQRYALLALASAALFGISTPLSKLLLGHTTPLLLAGLLYLGSGIGLFAVWFLRKGRTGASELASAPLARGDLPWLGGAILTGGVLAPVLLLWGVSGMDASGASLLLNAEAVLTILVAAILFREHVSGRVWASAAVMLIGASLLAYEPGAASPVSLRAAAVLGACLLWGIDNNLTRNISAGDPVSIAMVKGFASGAVTIGLAMARGDSLPAPALTVGALLLGAASYGASLVLYILALRHLGSARTGAHFATSPFIGAAVAIALLGEAPGAAFLAALALMVVATWMLLTESHRHAHTHEPLEHSHRHVHDEHHQHEHEEGAGPAPHTHRHVHQAMTHAHPHLPDFHHRHRH